MLAQATVDDGVDVAESLQSGITDFFESFFAFFRPAHQEGIVPSRIKELARLKIASINDCDT